MALGDLEAAGFGAVVAIEPGTGAVKVMASNAPYDPNRVPDEIGKLFQEKVSTPLLNRATQGRYPPGSTFKVVTAAAGLESGVITPETTINAPGSIIDEGHELANDYNQDWGSISLDTALTNSVNTWFGQFGQKLGQDKLFKTMEEFGFGSIRRSTCPKTRCCPAVWSAKTAKSSIARTRSTSPGWRSARSVCWRRRCRSRWSPPPSPTTAS